MTEYIPIKPISINTCWQGRRFKTPKYNAFIQEMLYTMPKRKMIKGNVKIGIRLHLKSVLRSDIDNFLKPIIDCIVKRGWIEDDRYVMSLEVEKIKAPQEGIEIKIEPLPIYKLKTKKELQKIMDTAEEVVNKLKDKKI